MIHISQSPLALCLWTAFLYWCSQHQPTSGLVVSTVGSERKCLSQRTGPRASALAESATLSPTRRWSPFGTTDELVSITSGLADFRFLCPNLHHARCLCRFRCLAAGSLRNLQAKRAICVFVSWCEFCMSGRNACCQAHHQGRGYLTLNKTSQPAQS